jgi:hypothetical protein
MARRVRRGRLRRRRVRGGRLRAPCGCLARARARRDARHGARRASRNERRRRSRRQHGRGRPGWVRAGARPLAARGLDRATLDRARRRPDCPGRRTRRTAVRAADARNSARPDVRQGDGDGDEAQVQDPEGNGESGALGWRHGDAGAPLSSTDRARPARSRDPCIVSAPRGADA